MPRSPTSATTASARAGAMVWNDPSDPGYAETYTVLGLSASVDIGSRGVNPVNRRDRVGVDAERPVWHLRRDQRTGGRRRVRHRPVDGCAHLRQRGGGAGVICVVMYDLGSHKPPKRKWRQFSNDDNSSHLVTARQALLERVARRHQLREPAHASRLDRAGPHARSRPG